MILNTLLLTSLSAGLPYSLTLTRQLVDGVLGTVHDSLPSLVVEANMVVQLEPLFIEYSIVTKLEVK